MIEIGSQGFERYLGERGGFQKTAKLGEISPV
jgi:hypothetical protein